MDLMERDIIGIRLELRWQGNVRYVFLLWTQSPIPVKDKTIPAMVSSNLSV